MLEIEIVDSNLIEGGVEVFARAWRDGVQIGFGKDGTVDIERFRIFNPPVLVEDVNGTIGRQSTSYDFETNQEIVIITYYREDPEEALLQVLEQIISCVSKFDDGNIVSERRGNTTSTFYAEEDVGLWEQKSTWSAARAGADPVTNNQDIHFGEKENASAYNVAKHFFRFDTSAISTDTIDSAVFSMYSSNPSLSVGNETTYPADMAMVEGSFADTGTIGTTDWANAGDTILSNIITVATVDSSGSSGMFFDWTLNASGLSIVNGSGKTKLVRRTTNDINNNEPSLRSYTRGWTYSEATGTTQDPKLVVEHSAAPAGFPFSQAVIIA